MATALVTVRFLRHHRCFNPTEVAGVPAGEAAQLVASGGAELVVESAPIAPVRLSAGDGVETIEPASTARGAAEAAAEAAAFTRGEALPRRRGQPQKIRS